MILNSLRSLAPSRLGGEVPGLSIYTNDEVVTSFDINHFRQ
jgi:hypothetical protein